MEPPGSSTSHSPSPERPGYVVSRGRMTRGRKRRYASSDSSDIETVLPENILEMEKNLHASAIKNNLDDVSVKKILKKVVTNDHVLALVKLREEEENKAEQEEGMEPKLTRSKAKELTKVSPKTAWNLRNMELTPIKHIPVKTRPEVTALIAQELPEDEDDDEYEPTNDDVPSDDDHTLESCSDVDSQPRTPATPRRTASPRVVKDGPFKVPQSDDDHTLESCSDVDSQPRTPATPRRTASPRVVKDGPFKVPQNLTPRRKLDMESDSDATIALRTRSKLSLSSIPIDHIESSFVPPDEVPMPAADDVWTEFLQECLNPETGKEVDDEDDPEYNVAQDPDANDEDEEGLENIIKISKKELNDLVQELFSVMPEDLLTGKLASDPAPNTSQNVPTVPRWEGKQEVISDDETPRPKEIPTREARLSIGKTEPLSDTECQESEKENRGNNTQPPKLRPVTLSVVEASASACPQPKEVPAPAPLRSLLETHNTITLHVEKGAKILPEQIQILQQQLRQHVQLATSSFLQLFVHPVHWSLAPTYKDYLETLTKMTRESPKSVANVCNLKPAMDLMTSWEKSVSADTEENAEMVAFIHKEIERGRRRAAQNNLYVGDFHKTFMHVVANSPVFLYPYLLPPLPFRSDGLRRFSYLRSEDELIALGVDEFWNYVELNPDIYKVKAINTAHRWGLVTTVQLVCKHMFPWIPPKGILGHMQHVRRSKDPDNPINKFFTKREVTPVKHVLLPFNPNITLYEQPEYEMPRVWVRYLAKSSKRFRDHYYRRTGLNKVTGNAPVGVPVSLGTAVEAPAKKPLPVIFHESVNTLRNPVITLPPERQDKLDIDLQPSPVVVAPKEMRYKIIPTSTGAYLVPMLTSTVDTASKPICSSQIQETLSNNMPEQSKVPMNILDDTPSNDVSVEIRDAVTTIGRDSPFTSLLSNKEHCACCMKLRSITKTRQTFITDFFKTPREKTCPCKEKRKVKYPRATNKLRLLIQNYKTKANCSWQKLVRKLEDLYKELNSVDSATKSETMKYDLNEIVEVMAFQLKLTIRTNNARYVWLKRNLFTALSRFDPDKDDIYVTWARIEKVLRTECVDMYKEFVGFLTMEQADKMGQYLDYFRQECLTDLIKKVEELVPNKELQHDILSPLPHILSDAKLNACELCVCILGLVGKYPALAEYVFSLFPHRKYEGLENAIQITLPETTKPKKKTKKKKSKASSTETTEDENSNTSTDNIDDPPPEDLPIDNVEDSRQLPTDNAPNQLTRDNIEDSRELPTDNVPDQLTRDNIDATTTDNIDAMTTDNVDAMPTDNIDAMTTDNIDAMTTDNMDEESVHEEVHVMDYEADHSASDDGSTDNNLTIIEHPDEIHSRVCIIKTEPTDTNPPEPINDPLLTVTKTEIQENSDSEMSMMIMSEDEIIKTEPTEWRREEDKLVLQLLQQSLSPEEMKDKTIIEIIDQKDVLQQAAENLPDKSLDEVRERMLYLLEFLAE